MRRKLRDRIRRLYRTQDHFAYKVKLDNSLISRFICETRDPTEEQLQMLCSSLGIESEDVLESDEKE